MSSCNEIYTVPKSNLIIFYHLKHTMLCEYFALGLLLPACLWVYYGFAVVALHQALHHVIVALEGPIEPQRPNNRPLPLHHPVAPENDGPIPDHPTNSQSIITLLSRPDSPRMIPPGKHRLQVSRGGGVWKGSGRIRRPIPQQSPAV